MGGGGGGGVSKQDTLLSDMESKLHFINGTMTLNTVATRHVTQCKYKTMRSTIMCYAE